MFRTSQLTMLTCKLSLFVLLFSVSPGADAGADTYHYWIKEHVALDADVVTFGHIAEPKNSRATQNWANVEKLQLWRAPQAGQRIVLSRDQVMARLNSVDAGLGRQSIIPREITFQRGARVFNQDELMAMVTEYLRPRINSMGGEVEFRDFRLPSPVYLENAFEKIEIETSTEPAPGRTSLRINIVDAHGSVSRRLTGNVFIDVWVTVACASRPLNRGDIVNPGDVSFERKNLAYLRDDVWDGKTGPWRVRSSVGQGQPILMRALEGIPVVSRGDQVSLVYQGQHVTLSVPVQVLEDGQKGDSIMVRNMRSRKEVAGIVQDGGTVVVR
ncbi:MAG: flagella basal body P-ring formation protein FlgA [Desulfonatronovibrio sp. MSAO_Bac4]|nr:MAG: flagella basal body P-ring formation protein FlgA [Desulfonatronovibrio sp. MSAO_Bac4]